MLCHANFLFLRLYSLTTNSLPGPRAIFQYSKLQRGMAPNDNWISKTVQSGVASAGSMAGGVVDSAGKSVEGAGKGVGNR